MASIFQPPPTYALPVVVDEVTGRSVFNPIWLRWFLDLSKGLSAGGTPSGAIVGPPTSITGHVVLWDNATGSLLKDGGALGSAAYQNSTVFQPAGTYVNSVSVTAPLTSTGGVAPSLGMVNQGTTTTVLHGNAAGNPSFGSVTAADAPALVPYTVPQDLQDWTGFLFPDTVQSTYDSTARTVTITSPVPGQLFYYWQGSKKTLGDGTTWTSSAHTATVGSWFLSSADGTTFTWATGPWEFYQLMMAYVYYGATDRFGIRETHGTMGWQTHQEFHETAGTYLHQGGDIGGYTLASTTPAFRRPTVSATTVKDEDLETINAALSSSLYTKVFLTSAGTTNFTVETADIVPLLGNNPYYNSFTTPNWTQTLMANNSYMNVWLVAVPAQGDVTSQKYRYLWIQGQENGSLAAMQAVTPTSVNVGTFVNIFTEFVFIGRIILRYQGGNWELTEVTKLIGTRINQAYVSGGFISAANIAGGLANQVVYQSAPGTTSFVTAPTLPSTYLQWTGAAFAWAAAGGSGSGGQGTFTIDFGGKATDKTVSVSVPAIATGQTVKVWVLPEQTVNNEIDNHWFEIINVVAYNVVNATGFTATATSNQGFLHGIFNFGYSYE